MRLWHKDLIPYLPKQQLIAQWRECCAICSNIANKGTPNHLLVNKVKEFHAFHFWNYCSLIGEEFNKRGYKLSKKSFNVCAGKVKSKFLIAASVAIHYFFIL